MLHHNFSDKQFVVDAILRGGANSKTTRRLVMYVVINFLFGGRSPDPAKAELAKAVLLRSFKNVI